MTSTAAFNISGRLFGNINLGPLTSTFTPPSSCLTELFLPGSDAPLSAIDIPASMTFVPLVPTGTFPILGWPTQTQCYPAGYQAASSAFRAAQGARPVTFGGYFSPAPCPAGYTSACPEEVLLSSAGEEIAVCCPRGYRCWGLLGSCISAFTAATTGSYVAPEPGRLTTWWLDASYVVSSGSGRSTSVMSALAAAVQVRRGATDSVAWPADPTASQGPSQSPTVTRSERPLPAAPVKMPSIGPEIYLSVGIPSALVLLGLVLYLVRARRARKTAAMRAAGGEPGVLEKAELAGECVVPHESGGSTRVELDAIEAVPVAELEVPVAELQGDAAAGGLGGVVGDVVGEGNVA